MLIQVASYDSGIGVGHDEFRAALAIHMTSVRLNHGLTDELIMINLQLTSLVRIIEGTLEVSGNLLLSKLLFNATDNRHDSLDVLVEDVSLLQTLERYLTVLCTSFVLFCCIHRQSLVSDIIHNGRRSLIRRDVSCPRLATLDVEQLRIEVSLSTRDSPRHLALLCRPIGSVVTMQSASA